MLNQKEHRLSVYHFKNISTGSILDKFLELKENLLR